MPGGLRLTPFHPVLVNVDAADSDKCRWAFPIDIGKLETGDSYDSTCLSATNCSHLMVFDFLLDADAGGTVLVNGITAATLGHGIHGDPVVSHAFFGSREAVLEDLQRRRGWVDGFVALDGGDMQRGAPTAADPQGRVIGFGAELE